MGLFGSGLEKGLQQQKQSLIKEVEGAGGEILQVEEIILEQNNAAGRMLGSSLKALVGGKVSADSFQLFRLRSAGLQHLYVQPYSGGLPLPGEHHALIVGSLPARLHVDEGFWAAKWESKEGPSFAKQVDEDKEMKRLLKKIEWGWESGMSKIELKWTGQARSTGLGETHVVLKAGRYGGITTYEVGFGVFSQLCERLAAWTEAEVVPEQRFPFPTTFGEMALGWLREAGTAVAASSPSSQPTESGAEGTAVDYAQIVREHWGTIDTKGVYITNFVDKKLNNVRKHVLPDGMKDADIVAYVDLTLFGSSKDAVVFTPTHCIAKEMDDPVVFDLRELEAVVGTSGFTGSTLRIRLRRLGESDMPCGSHAEALEPLLKEIAAANG